MDTKRWMFSFVLNLFLSFPVLLKRKYWTIISCTGIGDSVEYCSINWHSCVTQYGKKHKFKHIFINFVPYSVNQIYSYLTYSLMYWTCWKNQFMTSLFISCTRAVLVLLHVKIKILGFFIRVSECDEKRCGF